MLEVRNGKPKKADGHDSEVKINNRKEETVSSGVILQFISGQIKPVTAMGTMQ